MRIDYSAQPPAVVLEDYRGQVVSRLTVPLKHVTFEGVEDDLWALGRVAASSGGRWVM